MGQPLPGDPMTMTAPPAHSQLCLRPFDVGVALRLLLVPEDRYDPMAHALATSTSAVHRSVMRLRQAGICNPGTRTVDVTTFLEFAMCCVPYAFPAVRSRVAHGMPTAFLHDDIAFLRHEGDAAYVWASTEHEVTGTALLPLFPAVPLVAARDARMYRLFSAVDAIRVVSRDRRGGVRDVMEQWIGTYAEDPETHVSVPSA